MKKPNYIISDIILKLYPIGYNLTANRQFYIRSGIISHLKLLERLVHVHDLNSSLTILFIHQIPSVLLLFPLLAGITLEL